MKLMTKSRCTCGQGFVIVHGCKNTCRADGKRVYPDDGHDIGWDSFRCPRCHAVVSDSVAGAGHEGGD